MWYNTNFLNATAVGTHSYRKGSKSQFVQLNCVYRHAFIMTHKIDQIFTSAQHLFSLIRIGLHVSTVIQSSSGPSQTS